MNRQLQFHFLLVGLAVLLLLATVLLEPPIREIPVQLAATGEEHGDEPTEEELEADRTRRQRELEERAAKRDNPAADAPPATAPQATPPPAADAQPTAATPPPAAGDAPVPAPQRGAPTRAQRTDGGDPAAQPPARPTRTPRARSGGNNLTPTIRTPAPADSETSY